jgi:dolichyl-phosphate-mannose--protein O-mannosyl transferase
MAAAFMNSTLTMIIGAASSILVGIIIYMINKHLETDSESQIRYRDVVKLIHSDTGNHLHSHLINYSHLNSSGQQQVTAYEHSDENDYWVVKGPQGTPQYYRRGRAVRNGATVRLEHRKTGRNLHSHNDVPSPVTGQQEVTAHGAKGIGDDNDNWRVELSGGRGWRGSRRWRAGIRLKLIHVKTGKALHSHRGKAHMEYTAGQQEVTCYGSGDQNDYWEAVRAKRGQTED